VSVLEHLVLGETRCHQVVYKVVAGGEQTARSRLHGHTIIFPQKVEVVADALGRTGADVPFGTLAAGHSDIQILAVSAHTVLMVNLYPPPVPSVRPPALALACVALRPSFLH
jgi:hypothetical protein